MTSTAALRLADLELPPAAHESPDALLDRTLAALEQGQPVAPALASLVDGLDRIRLAYAGEWPRIRAQCRIHPLYDLLGADPLVAAARRAPRGVASDRLLLDALDRGCDATVSPVGRALFAATSDTRTARVR